MTAGGSAVADETAPKHWARCYLYPSLLLREHFERTVVRNQRISPGGHLNLEDRANEWFVARQKEFPEEYGPLAWGSPDLTLTDLGERAFYTVLSGYVFDLQTGMRSIAETRRWYVNVLQRQTKLSVRGLSSIEKMPERFFEEIHEAAVIFRLASSFREGTGDPAGGIWLRSPVDD